MRERFSLERFSPALYGWLVWGGGFNKIVKAAKLVGLILIAAALFEAGRHF